MQTTLRINDEIYREAKAEAAREGTTLTKFIEDGIRLKLQRKQIAKPFMFPVYNPGTPFPLDNDELKSIANAEQEKHDLAKLGLSPSDLL